MVVDHVTASGEGRAAVGTKTDPSTGLVGSGVDVSARR
jgi:hypothetical protein